MKRIIDGATYNTDTATVVAEGLFEDVDTGTVIESKLHQNRSGVYFNVDTTKSTYRDRSGEEKERTAYDWQVVGDAAKAREYVEQYSMTILRDIEDMPPEATPGEKMATVYLRVTPTLKSALDKASVEDKLSGNLWAARCIEQCLDRRGGPGLLDLAEAEAITRPFKIEGAIWTPGQMQQALQDINGLIANAAEEVLGKEDALRDVVAAHAGHERVVEALEKYAPKG